MKRILLIFFLIISVSFAARLRIISLSPLITEQVFLLGAENTLIGVTSYCRIPSSIKIEKIGNIVEINHEKIILLKPDFVLASDININSRLDRLTTANIKVYTIPEGKDFESICKSFLELARILNLTKRGETLVKEWEREYKLLKSEKTPLKKPKIFIVVGTKPLVTTGQNSFISAIVNTAGATNIVKEKLAYLRYSIEKILKEPPDLVLIVLPEEEAKEEKKVWNKFGIKTESVEPDIFSIATPPAFLKATEILSDILKKHKLK